MIPLTRVFYLLLVLVGLTACSKDPEVTMTSEQYPPLALRGVDASFLPEMEAYLPGAVFTDLDGTKADFLTILKNHGVNAVRIRLWHSPPGGHSGLSEVRVLAERVHAAGMQVWLTVHYSDTWADPGQQATPAKWQNLPFETLKDSLYAYTRQVVTAIEPDIIQIGNEVNNGFLFPTGAYPGQKNQFLELLQKGVKAVRDQDPQTKIMIHYAGTQGAKDFLTFVEALDYDQVGLSYYPWWHGKDLNLLSATLLELSQVFQKEVIIAETSYPFSLSWADQTNNIIGLESQLLLPDFPATPEGQKRFIARLREILAATPGGTGFCYWGGEWVAFKGPASTSGSPWENQALFNFGKAALPVWRVFAP